MIYLRKSFLRAAASEKLSGQITVWMALCFMVFLSLYLVCLQSVWKQFQKEQAEQAAEAGLFSLFSEFESHIFNQYDLFCLDTSFGSTGEREDELCSHLWQFTEYNLTDASGAPLYDLELLGVDIKNLVRLTDASGAVFYRQAVKVMKEKTGVSLAEDWVFPELFQKDAEENTRRFQEDCETYEGSIRDYNEEDEEDGEGKSLDPEASQWDGLWNEFVFEKAIPDGGQVSDRSVMLESAPSHRELSVGMGAADGTEDQMIQKQWFISYLCAYMEQAQKMLPVERKTGWLDYQLEYVIGGKETDRENLSAVVGRILLIREGMNYVFLLSCPELRQKAETLALLLAGITGNEGIIKGMEQLILLGWAYGESLVEVRQLLGGYELSPVKVVEDWQVSLSGLLPALKDPGRYDVQTRPQEGIDYEACLRLFLTMESAETLSMRALDIMEGELGCQNGCEDLHLDHCVDYLTAQLWIGEFSLERSYGYEY